MLTFKKGSYDKQDLHSLYSALAQSKVAFNCTVSGCENCPIKRRAEISQDCRNMCGD